jgi:hypothetical protein
MSAAQDKSASHIGSRTGGALTLETSRQPFGRDENDLFALDEELVSIPPFPLTKAQHCSILSPLASAH